MTSTSVSKAPWQRDNIVTRCVIHLLSLSLSFSPPLVVVDDDDVVVDVIFYHGWSWLKVESAILIQHAFCQIQRIASHSPLAVRSVCVPTEETKTLALQMGTKVARTKYTILANQHFAS